MRKYFITFAKISWNLCRVSRKSTILFSRNFAKFKIVSLKFRILRNFENAVSQPPYLECVAKNKCRIVAKNCLSTPTPPSSPHPLVGNNWNINWKSEAKKAKKSKRKEAKGSETKRKIILLVSQNEAKRKWNGFCFASFRFKAK